MKRVLLFWSVIFLSLLAQNVCAQDTLSNKKTVVYRFGMRRDIGPAIWRQTKQAYKEAVVKNANYFIIHMNTYGGAVVQADSIRTLILNSKIPVYVFIDNNAASAGALISIACDKIYMRKGGSIGAATVVNQTGQAMPDKYQSYMRSTMRATAEAQGRDTIFNGRDTIYKWKRDPMIAEAMVDQRIVIEGLVDSTKVLTFTPLEAIKYGFCDGMAEDVPELLQKEGIKDYSILNYRATFLEKIIGFLVSPIIQGILIMLIIGGIYFELQSPGVGFPLLAAIFAAIVYFAPLYLEGLAENYEILLFVLGVVLIALEVFVIPGFGIAGIAGIVLLIGGLVLSMVDNFGFNFEGVMLDVLFKSLAIVVLSFIFALFSSIYFTAKLFGNRKLAFALNTNIETQVDKELVSMIDKIAFSSTDLRPSGKIVFEGLIYDAISDSGVFIDKEEKVKIVKYDMGQVYVRKL